MQAADSFIRGQLASNSDSSACDVASQSDAEWRDCRLVCTAALAVHTMRGCACIFLMSVRRACEAVPCVSRTRHRGGRAALSDSRALSDSKSNACTPQSASCQTQRPESPLVCHCV